MRRLTFYIILLFLAVLMSSCELKAPSSDDDDEDNFLHDPSPYDNEIGVSLQPMLNWIYNANTNNISFTIYLDTVSTQMDSIAFVSNPSYNIPTPLEGNKTYYWQVKTIFEGTTYESNIWRFTTTDAGGILLSNPNPPDNATGVSLTPQLSWNYNGSNTIYYYEIYMDNNNPPTNYIGQTPYPNYYISTPLVAGTTYFWKIIAFTSNGTSEGNVWRFTTTGGLPTNGLMAYYPFNGNANDESGNYNNGINFGAILTYDRFNNSNKAYSFNGSSYIYAYHNQTLQPTVGLTLSAWVKFNNLNNTSSILAKGPENSKGCYNIKYDSSSGKLDFQINFSDYISGPRMTVSTYLNIQTYNWYNVIGIFDGNYMKIYLNGQFENSIYVPKTLGSNYEALYLGSNAEANYLNGDLDDIRIYNRALNETEIQQLFNEGSGSRITQLKQQKSKN